jgi:hypothetical protein
MMSESAGTAMLAATDDLATQAVSGVETPERDRRRSRRMPYACTGMAAAYLAPDVPANEAFWMVRCRDLSRGGVSFYSPIKPTTSSLVLNLGSLDNVRCLLACRVVYCAYVGNQGQPQYLVGCGFLERLD